MNNTIKEAKKHLINLMCNEAKEIINNSTAKYRICKIGWVDYIHKYGEKLIQHEFTMAYVSQNNEVILIDKTGSEGETMTSKNLRMNQVTDIEKLEWILQGLKENN